MISNKELYEQIFIQYLHKGYNEERADYIASKVVNRQRSHLRGQQQLVSAGWEPGNMDLAPLINDGGTEDDAEKQDAQYNIMHDLYEIEGTDYNHRDDNPRCVEEQQRRRTSKL